MQGKRFARRNKLQKADAIVVLAGTRGNIKFLDSKIQTAVHLLCRAMALISFAVADLVQK